MPAGAPRGIRPALALARRLDEDILEVRRDDRHFPRQAGIVQEPAQVREGRLAGLRQDAQVAADLRDAQHARLPRQRALRLARLRRDHFNDAPRERARQFDRRAVGDQLAVVEYRQPVAALGLVHQVRRHQDRDAAVRELEELLPEIAARLGIHGARGLVEEQELGLVDDGAGEREPLLLPAAHRAGELPLPVGEIVLRDQRRRPAAWIFRLGTSCAAARNSRFSRTDRSSNSENFCVM